MSTRTPFSLPAKHFRGLLPRRQFGSLFVVVYYGPHNGVFLRVYVLPDANPVEGEDLLPPTAVKVLETSASPFWIHEGPWINDLTAIYNQYCKVHKDELAFQASLAERQKRDIEEARTRTLNNYYNPGHGL